MNVSGDAGAGGFADVHAQVDSVGVIEFAQHVSMRCESAIISLAASDGSFCSSSRCA